MNKKLLFIPVILFGIAACSTKPVAIQSGDQATTETKATQGKAHKRSHKTMLEGVISLDIVNDNNRLHLLTGKQQQGQKTLWYQYSDDDGKTWLAASKVLDDNNIPAKMTRGNDAQITAQGKAVVIAWTKFDKTARFKAGAMLAARSTDNGQSWEYVSAPPDWVKGPHGYIDLASDKQAMHAVWLDSRSGRSSINASQGLRYARSTDGGLHWQTNQTLDTLTCSCCWNTIKSDAEGNAYVLYRDKQPSDLSIGVINPQQQWQRLSHVGAFDWQFDGCPHIGGGLDFQKTSGKNRMHAIVGTGHPEHLGIHYSYSDDAGKNWSKDVQLGDESAIHSDIAAHNNGRVVAVWDMMGEYGLAIYAAESKDRGYSWSSTMLLSASQMRASHPRIVKTKTGFLALWTESDGRSQKLQALRL